ncbi:4-alpha-glucanotransferase [Pasteurellaceae bacterium LFhippo2]|nr:4-alpha-glucanotransferase [Pasteurellaceae bacterium LFhippo2]
MQTHDYFFEGFNGGFATHNAVAELIGESSKQQDLPFAKVFQNQTGCQIQLATYDYNQHTWQLVLETGEKIEGQVEGNLIVLPNDLPLGYHLLTLAEQQCRVIITPEKAYQPEALKQGKKLWGAFLQLYTLRSEQNWGVGDFGDLQQFLIKLAEQGGDFVGLNPIHSLFPANPESVSPYSPSSRLWQNIIYIDVSALAEFQQSEAAQQWFNRKETQQALKQLRKKEYVDYSQVMALKLQGLGFAYTQFKQQDQNEFEQFIAESGESLRVQGTFDALHQWLTEQFSQQWGWNNWAEQYQSYQSDDVKKFQIVQSDLVRFYMWLQFVAQQQLKACNKLAKQLAMPIGFYRDLAVGVSDNGAETWADKELYVLGASIGAPQDMLAPQGQNWGLSPMHPRVLVERGYQPFIDLLRANMKDCGALRIDHILGLTRLWWVLKGGLATEGVYIRYPLDDLLGILALESQRNQCLIVAEALGTVPEGMLEALEEKGILAFNVFYFEFENGESKALENYPYQAMTALSTHDLPTIKGYWQSYDFELGEKYNVYPSEDVLTYLKQNRAESKAAFRKAVEASGLKLEKDSENMSRRFSHQLQSYVANTNSALYGTQPEDWLNMLEPVNIPGTSSEYPNWRRKLSKTTEQIFADKGIIKLLEGFNKTRKA